MQFKRICQLTFVLFMAITITACTGSRKKKTPGDNNEEDGEQTQEEIRICTEYPVSEYCSIITNNTKLKVKDVKPIQKHGVTGSLLTWSNYLLYSKGFQYQSKASATYNFSVDTGSTLAPGDQYTFYLFYAEGSRIGHRYTLLKGIEISSTIGGSIFKELNTDVGNKLIAVAVFPDKTYLALPPMEIVA